MISSFWNLMTRRTCSAPSFPVYPGFDTRVFDPRVCVSPLAARLLAASNGLHTVPTDGWPVSEPFTSRHAPCRPLTA